LILKGGSTENLKSSGFCSLHGVHQEIAKKPSPVTGQIKKPCGKALPSGSEAYRCHTCEKNGNMALCPTCFHNGNHKGILNSLLKKHSNDDDLK
jgi:predicted RNA-binding Zn-ribbon protein involved in translation (DUF1610 family)